MKILKIIHGFPPENSGGTESYVLRLARELIAEGHEVEVLTGSMHSAGAEAERPELVHGVHEGVPVHRLHRTGLYIDNWEKSLAPEVGPRLEAILRDFAPDLVHVHHWIRLTRNLIEICHDLGFPAVATLHDVLAVHPAGFRITEASRRGPRFGDPSTDRLEPILAGHLATEAELRQEYDLYREDMANELRLARRLIVPSLAHRDLLLGFDPSLEGRFRVLPHGTISPIAPRKAPPRQYPTRGPLRIAHWGHLSRVKGADLLLEAVRGLPKRERVHLDVFGGVVFPDEKALIDRLAEGLDITWHGPFGPSELQRVPFDLAVFPSRCHESYSFVVDEAVLLGVPVLGPDLGALGERLRPAGSTFAPEDANSLRAAIERVLEDPSLLDRWIERAPRLTPMSEHVRSMLSVYKEVLSSRAALPVTPPSLRARRTIVRSFQLERQKYTQSHLHARLGSLGRDYLAKEALVRERDAELAALRERVRALEVSVARLAELDEQHRLRATAERARDLARAERDAAEERISALRISLSEAEIKRLSFERGATMERMKAAEARSAALRADAGASEERLTEALRGLDTRIEAARIEARRRIANARLERDARIEALEAELQNRQQGASSQDPAIQLLAPERAPNPKDEDQDLLAALRALADFDAAHADDAEELARTLPPLVRALARAAALRLKHEDAPHREALARRLDQGTERLGERLLMVRDRLRGLLAEAEDAHRHGSWQAGWLARYGETLEGLLAEFARLLRRSKARPPADRAKASRLKILFLVHQYLPRHVAGTEIYTHRLAKELSARHDVVIVTAESDFSRERFELRQRRHDGLPVWEMIHNYRWHDFRDTYDCPEADAVFRRILRDEAPDVVHVQHLHHWSANCITIAKMQGLPVVYTLHDYWLLCPNDGQLRRPDGRLCDAAPGKVCAACVRHPVDLAHPAPLLPRGLHPVSDALVSPVVTREVRRRRARVDLLEPAAEAGFEREDYLRSVMEDVDLFISPSAFLRDRMVATGFVDPSRIIVSDNGYDLSPFQGFQRTRGQGLRVGYVGTIAPHKGVHVLVEALNGITDERISTTIWGDLAPFPDYADRLRSENKNPRTLFMGPFPPDSLTTVLANLDLLVVPSLWYENSPLTVHEAAMAGVPVLVSDLGGLAEYVREDVNGRRFKMGDAQALREQILSFLTRPIANFDPAALIVKPIAQDAIEMEARYLGLVQRAAAWSD